jgi:hypothetical protein
MLGHVIHTGIMKNACKDLDGKSEREIPFGRHEFMWHDKENLSKKKEEKWGLGLKWFRRSVGAPIARFCATAMKLRIS